MEHFLEQHKEVDEGLKREKARITLVKRIFVLVDIIMSFGVIPSLLWIGFQNGKEIMVFASVLTLQSVLLAIFSYWIGRIMKRMTGSSINVRMISIHITNMVLLCLVAAM